MSILSNEWSITGPDSQLVDKTDLAAVYLQIPVTNSLDRKGLEEIKFRAAKYFSMIRLGFLSLGAPTASDIEIFSKELFYIPFWRIQGSYACRYVRKATYPMSVSSDVEEVRINGGCQQITSDRRRISDIVSEIASSSAIPVGLGPVPLTPFQGSIRSGMQKGVKTGIKSALGSKDKEISHKLQLSIDAEEIASFALKSELCFNGHLGREDRKMSKALENVTRFESLNEETTKNSLAIHFSKEDIVQELKRTIVKLPEFRPRRVLEQAVVASKLELIYTPYFRFVIESKGHRKTVEFNALTGEDYIPKYGM